MTRLQPVPSNAAGLERPASADQRRLEIAVLTDGLSNSEAAKPLGGAALWGAVGVDADLADLLLGEAKRLAERDRLTALAITSHLNARA